MDFQHGYEDVSNTSIVLVGSVHWRHGYDAKAVPYSCFVCGAIAVALRPGVRLWAGNPCPLLPPQPLAQVLWTIQLWAQTIQTHSADSSSLAGEQPVCSYAQSGNRDNATGMPRASAA